jgi:sulfonate transport system permease protein
LYKQPNSGVYRKGVVKEMGRTKPYIVIAAVIVLWGIGSFTGLFNAYLVPSPWKVGETGWKLIMNGMLFRHMATSFYRVVVGFAITICLAFPMGLLVGLHKTSRAIWEAPLNFIRHIPPLATAPILILWFGIGEPAKLTIIVLSAFFPVFLNTASGVSNCDPKLIEVGKVLGYRPFARLIHIILPFALPSILVGLQLGIGYSWRALMGAELLAAAAGLGYMIIEAEQLSRPDIVIVGILTIGLMGLVIDILFDFFSSRLMLWRKQERTYVQG